MQQGVNRFMQYIQLMALNVDFQKFSVCGYCAKFEAV